MTTVAIGGTFNILHIGHKTLLERAFRLGDLILIGLTTDEMANTSRKYKVHPYRKRRKVLLNHLHSKEYGKKFTILPISDKYGITLDNELDILVVSPETAGVGKEINHLRRKAGKSGIKIEVVDHVIAEDGKPVSSTRVANGEITPDGMIRTVFTLENFPKDLAEALSKDTGKQPILVHICCAPCIAHLFSCLSRDFLPIGFYYNTNIQPFREYKRRLEALKDLSHKKKLRVIYRDVYDPGFFFTNIVEVGLERGERCAFCYRHRLEATAELAKTLGIRKFTTTLLSSPHQLHELVKKIGEEVSARYDLEFHYFDIREHNKEGVNEVRGMGLYTQNYCGCIFSERDRFYRKLIQ